MVVKGPEKRMSVFIEPCDDSNSERRGVRERALKRRCRRPRCRKGYVVNRCAAS